MELFIVCYVVTAIVVIALSAESAERFTLAAEKVADQGAVQIGAMTLEDYIKKWPSVFDYFLQHDFLVYMNTIGLVIFITALIIFTIEFASRKEIKDISSTPTNNLQKHPPLNGASSSYTA